MDNLSLASLDTLPFVRFDSLDALPPASGVYLALSASNDVLYVGATIDLRQRWKQHHRVERLQRMGCARIAWYACEGTVMSTMECALIQQFQPPLNQPWHPTSPGPTKQHRSATSLLLSQEAKRLLYGLAESSGISQAARLELLIREQARVEGIS